jgi:hypothetical protein
VHFYPDLFQRVHAYLLYLNREYVCFGGELTDLGRV